MKSLVALALMAVATAWATPKVPTQTPTSPESASSPTGRKPDLASLVELNTASVAQLKTLPGIGDDEARRIVQGRPYLVKTNLITRKVLSEQSYDALKDRVKVVPRLPASGAAR